MLGFAHHSCWKCKIEFYIPDALHNALYATRNSESKASAYCPNGHGFVIRSEFEEQQNDKIRRERDQLKQDAARLEDEKRDLQNKMREKEAESRRKLRDKDRKISAAKGQVTKIKNRVGAGVCPCCNRTFAQLAMHMSKQHPHYRTEAA